MLTRTRTRARRWALAFGFAALAALALFFARRSRFDTRLSYAAGTRYRYALTWSTRDRVALPGLGSTGGGVDGEMTLTAELRLDAHGLRDGRQLLTASLEPIGQPRLAAMGKELWPDEAAARATLHGHRALLEVAPSGRVEKIGFLPGDPELFKNLVQSLAGEVSLTLPAAPSRGPWTVEEEDRIGRAEVRYDVRGRAALDRTRLRYRHLAALPDDTQLGRTQQSLDARAHFELDESGPLRALTATDELRVELDGQSAVAHHAELTLRLTGSERLDGDVAAPALAGLELRSPTEVVITEDAHRALLTQRAAGLTSGQLVSDLFTLGATVLGERPEWLWRASGVLILHPEACRELVAVFGDAESTDATRRLVLDLLTAAGHGEAQAVLRQLLDGKTALHEPGYPLLLQRLALVEHPTPETVKFLAERRTRAQAADERETARASLFALGAAAGRLAATDPEAARPYAQLLGTTLTDARTVEDRESALRAIGNAGLPEHLPATLRESHAGDAEVRTAAAAALRKSVTPESTTRLVELAADEPEVAAEAIASLRNRPLDRGALDGLTNGVQDGRVPSDVDAGLYDLALSQLKAGADDGTAALLRALLARTRDPQLASRIRRLVGDAS